MLITGATLADGRVRDVRIDGDTIAAVASSLESTPGERVVDAHGKHLLPGAVDVHVHFREPGGSNKETWETGSKSAAAGGVTTVVDQPNTDPPTVDAKTVEAKTAFAAASRVDYGINGGVTPAWDPDELFDAPIFALGEVFLADSTGEMGIDADLFARAAARAADADTLVTVHAEDATEFDETALEGDLGGAGTGAQIHVAHTSTPAGIDAVTEAAARGVNATCEVTPHHLFLSRDDADRLGTFGRMNPPLRGEERREGVFERLREGEVDVVATDHAPHTVEEKSRGLREAPSGVPGVETMYPLLLNAVRTGDLSLERVRDVVAATPASIFGLADKGTIMVGTDADLVLVDLDAPRDIEAGALHSKCGWTPFEGLRGVFPELTLVRGAVAYERDPHTGAESFGEPLGTNVRTP